MGDEQPRHLIGLDLGTSCIKGVVMDEQGSIICTAEKPTQYTHPQKEWVQADAKDYLNDVLGVIRQLATASPAPIRALAFAAASGNTLLCDSSGNPLSPIINWMDQRAVQDLPSVLKEITEEQVWKVAGWPCIDIFPLAHLAWLREHEPKLFRSAGRYCMNTDWLLFQLTGKWLMDSSTATTFHLQDQVSGRYHQPFLDLLDIPENKLSKLVSSGVSAGSITSQMAEQTGLSIDTEVITGCFDHPSAARAMGILNPGQLLLSCGTSWVGFFPGMDRDQLIQEELLCDPFLSDKGGPWGGLFSVPYIGKTIDAYICEIIAPGEPDPYAVFNDAAGSINKTPVTIDLREPVQAIHANRAEISRAVMEGAARLLNEEIVKLAASGTHFKEATMVGGPSRSPVWQQIVEEITQIKLTAGTSHSGAKGAAMLAGIGAGIYTNEKDAWEKTR